MRKLLVGEYSLYLKLSGDGSEAERRSQLATYRYPVWCRPLRLNQVTEFGATTKKRNEEEAPAKSQQINISLKAPSKYILLPKELHPSYKFK